MPAFLSDQAEELEAWSLESWSPLGEMRTISLLKHPKCPTRFWENSRSF